MSLYKNWHQAAFDHKTQQTALEFWNEFSPVEEKIYALVLDNHTKTVAGSVKELAEKFGTTSLYVMGFLDGINDSLKTALPIEELTEESIVSLDIDFEKLYYNMWDAQAEELRNLSQWDSILTMEKRKEIEKQYKASKTVVKGPKIGRNDPCPCQSGKKYKKCCGVN